ncbi:endonuclease domain-containing protein [Paenibacillus sp. N4]|uniref:DUF559 domain-containing protein n=1 Tax=Paenibacillus vietnamensis TaxID=2590547 RepID=UPI001CD0BE24|nr:DUF559 domain-containing protein [Paenibacillus vietnamensis]MCA0756522.1 endonuclease domain-containing protein [Paenibacillus vietnamensis]
MSFEKAHALFMKGHLDRRSGERRGRLERGHLHAEQLFLKNIWWELHGHFEHLHPEYEVLDWRGRSYFADFAWLRGPLKLIIEIKGYAAHVRDMDRQKYCNELNRETFLRAMGWHVISFAYDDVEQRPELCISLLRMLLSHYAPERMPSSDTFPWEKEMIRLAISLTRPIRPKDVSDYFKYDHRTAVAKLKKLSEKKWLIPAYGKTGTRVVRYELAKDVLSYF